MQRLLFGFFILAIIVTLALRILPHAPNFTPVGALALFAGVYLSRKHWWGLLVPVCVLALSDLFIGVYDFKLMVVVYISFLMYALFGMAVSRKKNIAKVALGGLAGAFFFYLSTNFAVWAFSAWYPHTLEGLMLSYTLALPFLKYTLLGDLFFVGVFFGAYELALAVLRHKALKLSRAKLTH